MRASIVAIALLMAATANAEWLTNLDEAIVRARAERKFVLLYLRNGWCTNACNTTSDERVKQRDTNSTITHLYDAFVRVRVDAPWKNGRQSRCAYPLGDGKFCDTPRALHATLPHAFVEGALKRVLDARYTDPPAFVVLDGSGEVFAAFGANDHANIFAGILGSVRTERERVARSAELRLAGKTAEADLQLGIAMVAVDAPNSAKAVLGRASDAFHLDRNFEKEQIANVWIGYSEFLIRDTVVGETMVRRQLFRAASPTVEAEAWLAIGAINRRKRDLRSTLSAYRKAYAVAPAGSEQAAAARAFLETMDDRPVVPKEPSTSASVRLLAPGRATMLGPIHFVAEAEASVARIDFFLDDVSVGSTTTRPFRQRIDLGNTARARTVKAVAISASGQPVGESSVTVNDRGDSFRVFIASPTGEKVSGPTVVEADAQAPEGRKVKQVELFWRENKVATLTAPPYRHRLEVPNEFGYFRAVGTLDDGTTAETTRVVNAAGGTDSVEVQAVMVIATAVDANGERISGLQAGDFLIREEGVPIAAQVWESDDQPATIGLAIDASASMAGVYLDLIDISETFLTIAAERGDRVFLVSFAQTPKLLHSPTTDVEALRKVLRETKPGGSTALYDGIAFGLQQLQDVRGRKALVVITDGQEVLSFTRGNSTHRLAHEVGAPVYPIVPWPGYQRAEGYGVGALQRLSGDTGGLTFVSPPRAQRAQIFARIRDEVRGQYILSFMPPKGIRAGTWRDLEVTLPSRSDVKLRTVKGYYAR